MGRTQTLKNTRKHNGRELEVLWAVNAHRAYDVSVESKALADVAELKEQWLKLYYVESDIWVALLNEYHTMEESIGRKATLAYYEDALAGDGVEFVRRSK